MGWLVGLAEFKTCFGVVITLCGELGTDLTASTAARISQEDLAGRSGMVGQKTGEEGGVIPFVQEVTPDDEIESTEFHHRIQPWGVEKRDRRQSVEICISAEKFFRQRVVVASGNIGTALLQHQTGETDSTTYLENVFA